MANIHEVKPSDILASRQGNALTVDQFETMTI